VEPTIDTDPAGPAVALTGVTKVYRRGSRPVTAVRDLTLRVPCGEFVTLMGPSGSGKTSVLNLVAGLDRPTRGDITVGGVALAALDDDALTAMRRTRVGMVFQFFNLLPELTALENVAFPLRIAGVRRRAALDRAREALAQVGLAARTDHRPDELSGGEMQRTAIARALVIEPALVLADEPTGNLDSHAGDEILALLAQCNRERGVTILLVTHSEHAARYGTRVVTLQDGTIARDDAVLRSLRSGERS